MHEDPEQGPANSCLKKCANTLVMVRIVDQYTLSLCPLEATRSPFPMNFNWLDKHGLTKSGATSYDIRIQFPMWSR